MSPPVDAVLLAGGRGRRAGGPKAFKRVDGELAWRRQARLLLQAGAERVAVVIHPDRPADDLAEPVPDTVLVVASTPQAEMFASLQAGLRALRQSDDHGAATLILPVDCPLAGLPVTDALLAALGDGKSSPPAVIRPVFEGRRGHPIVLSAALCEDLAAGSSNRRLDHIIRALAAQSVRDVAVEDPAILANHNRDGVSR